MNLRKNTVFSIKYVIASLVILALVGAIAVELINRGETGVIKDRYQLVSLVTGERYIGKLSNLSGEYATLTDVYYQQDAPVGQSQANATEITVAKLSASVAKPEDTMRIAKDKIVHWENLQDDGKIVQAIKQSK